VQASTLLLGGDDDPIVPLANAPIIARLVPNAELHVVEGGGHLFLLDGTAGIGRRIGHFLDID
jgi:pimeloyl-ACP methyl ester carboxylesterase